MSGAPRVLVVMGVSGSGKTTVGKLLAEGLGWTFKEGDTLHPPANIAKMKTGHPLDDADRKPWLEAIGRWIDDCLRAGRSGVITCSALKRAYRDQIAHGRPQVTFVFLDLDQATIAERLEHRTGHFMPPSLLASQFADLQPPDDDEPVIRTDGRESSEAQAQSVIDRLRGETC
jgi:carbohydrate kinase (thermoresistant glucokinase family)